MWLCHLVHSHIFAFQFNDNRIFDAVWRLRAGRVAHSCFVLLISYYVSTYWKLFNFFYLLKVFICIFIEGLIYVIIIMN